jgi:hypothetical protein
LEKQLDELMPKQANCGGEEKKEETAEGNEDNDEIVDDSIKMDTEDEVLSNASLNESQSSDSAGIKEFADKCNEKFKTLFKIMETYLTLRNLKYSHFKLKRM